MSEPLDQVARTFITKYDAAQGVRQALENRAFQGGSLGGREVGCWDGVTVRAITNGALASVIEILRIWAAQDGAPPAAARVGPQCPVPAVPAVPPPALILRHDWTEDEIAEFRRRVEAAPPGIWSNRIQL